ncbi:DUF4339 domain-containing protein [Flaviaesturariibacter amylovorans]|uniref:GYF domain-containing protein n=1 Tax=Flaviaesturariibacter amylovorans TaxID=1084520 RepID=A0ABP8HH74_9BACT
MKKYYIIDGQEQKGPFSVDELKALTVNRDTYVWYEGADGWSKAGALDELGEVFRTPPPFTGTKIESPITPPPFSRSDSAPIEQVPVIRGSKNNIAFIPIGIGAIVVLALVFLYINGRQETALVQSQISQMQADESQKEQERRQKEEEKKRALEELTRKNRNYRNNWTTYFTATRSEYRYSALGGIYGLKVIFQNNSEYMADEMVATVTYIKANGGVWDRVDIPVTNVPAYSEKTVSVPDVERGTSVQVDIKRISSKKLHIYVGDNYYSGNPEDPYFAK